MSNIIPELQRAGHRVSLWHEIDEPANREQIALPDGVQSWSVEDIGAKRALAALREWQPDLIYSHGLHDTELEERAIEIAPTVFFAHVYYGTCISGSKAFKKPTVMPCNRTFGWQCLLHYYPRRCGGLSPVTMLKQYRTQSNRLGRLQNYKAIVTHSEHMVNEYLRHGVEQDRIHKVSYPAVANPIAAPAGQLQNVRVENKTGTVQRREPLAINFDNLAANRSEWRLLFLGRMDALKGGRIFLDALPQVATSLDRPLRVTFAGDGPDRQKWESRAAKIKTESQRLIIEFTGWVQGHEIESLLDSCDLLVFPSLWPEPFGLVGLEAGLHGLPSAAFAVGGIGDWLIDGVNGSLAPGNPPTAAGLAEAILKCLRDPGIHSQLRRGAIDIAQRFCMETHLSALLKVFARIAQDG